jgi:hypothetical protein
MEKDVSLASAWAPEARSPDAELPLLVLLVGGFIVNVTSVCVERWRPHLLFLLLWTWPKTQFGFSFSFLKHAKFREKKAGCGESKKQIS